MCFVEWSSLGYACVTNMASKTRLNLSREMHETICFFNEFKQQARLSDSNTLLQSNQSTTLAPCVYACFTPRFVSHTYTHAVFHLRSSARWASLLTLPSRSICEMFGSVFIHWCRVCIDIFFLIALRPMQTNRDRPNHCSNKSFIDTHTENRISDQVYFQYGCVCATHTQTQGWEHAQAAHFVEE